MGTHQLWSVGGDLWLGGMVWFSSYVREGGEGPIEQRFWYLEVFYVFSFWKVSIVSQPSLPQYTFLWYLIDFVRNKWLRKTIRYTHFTLSKNGIFAESFYSLNNFVLLLKKNAHVVMRKPSWFGFTDHECHANSIWDSNRRISLPTENDMVKSKGVEADTLQARRH